MQGNKFMIFSSQSRVKIIVCLLGESKTVTQLVEKSGISRSAVFQHLKILKEENIVESKNTENEKRYYLIDQKAGEIGLSLLVYSKII